MGLHKYWFRFKLSLNDSHPIGTLLGCGVTASSKEDAVQLLCELVFQDDGLPPILTSIEDVEMSQLDAKHVVPNIGNLNVRGVWFPMGYDAGQE